MKTLYININGVDIPSAEEQVVVGRPKHAIINKFYYELAKEIVNGVNTPGIDDVKNKRLITDFESRDKHAFEEITNQWECVKQLLLGENPTGNHTIKLPSKYKEWLENHVDPVYNKIAKSLSSRDCTVEISIDKIYTNAIGLLVKNIDTTIRYDQFVVNDNLLDDDSQISKDIRKKIGKDVPFVPFDEYNKNKHEDGKDMCKGDEKFENETLQQTEPPIDIDIEKYDQDIDSDIAFVVFERIKDTNTIDELWLLDQSCPYCYNDGCLSAINNGILRCAECGKKIFVADIDYYGDAYEDSGYFEMHLLNSRGQKVGKTYKVPKNEEDCITGGPKIWYDENYSLIQVCQNPQRFILGEEEKFYNITRHGITEGNRWINSAKNKDDESEYELIPRDKNDEYGKYGLGMQDIVDKKTKRVVVHNIISPQLERLSDNWWLAYQINQEPRGMHLFNKNYHFFVEYTDDGDEQVYTYGYFSLDDNRMDDFNTELKGFAQENRIITVHRPDADGDEDDVVRIRDERGRVLCEVSPEEYIFKRPYQFGKTVAIRRTEKGNELVYFDTDGKIHPIKYKFLDLDSDLIDCTMVAPNRLVLREIEYGKEYLMDLNGNILFSCKEFLWYKISKDYTKIRFLPYNEYCQAGGIVDLNGNVVSLDYWGVCEDYYIMH